MCRPDNVVDARQISAQLVGVALALKQLRETEDIERGQVAAKLLHHFTQFAGPARHTASRSADAERRLRRVCMVREILAQRTHRAWCHSRRSFTGRGAPESSSRITSAHCTASARITK